MATPEDKLRAAVAAREALQRRAAMTVHQAMQRASDILDRLSERAVERFFCTYRHDQQLKICCARALLN